MTEDQTVADACISEARKTLAEAHEKIIHCVEQLSDEQIHHRPFESQNSMANLLLHLCGNLRQWVVSGVGGLPAHRDRPAEFADRTKYPKAELLTRLADAVAEADRTMADVTAQRLVEPVRIQGFDTTPMAAIWRSVSHFVGHSQEIIHITRDHLRENYRFKFVPKTKEQGA